MRALVFSVDDDYVIPFRVLWHTLVRTASIPEHTPIFILHEETLSHESIDALKSHIAHDGFSIQFLDVQHLIPKNVFLSDHISRATYYRLYIASILPSSVSSLVYLDSDAVVVRSVRELFNIKLEAPIAATDHMAPSIAFRLWGDRSGSYFQAGVLVIDLEMWRSVGYENIFSKILQEQSDRIRWWDQDVLNIAFENNWQRLPIWFNVCNNVITEIDHDLIASQTQFLHYDGSIKPWNSRNINNHHASQWYEAYSLCFGEAFNRRALQRSFWSRMVAAVKRILKYTIDELKSV